MDEEEIKREGTDLFADVRGAAFSLGHRMI